MDRFRTLTLNDESGIHLRYPLLPNCWQGETDCIVGPFSSQEVATYFAGYASEFGQYERFTYKVFPKRDAWYVEIQEVQAKVPVQERPLITS